MIDFISVNCPGAAVSKRARIWVPSTMPDGGLGGGRRGADREEHGDQRESSRSNASEIRSDNYKDVIYDEHARFLREDATARPADRGADRRGPRRRADGRQRRRRSRLLRAGRPRGDRGRALGGDDRPAPARAPRRRCGRAPKRCPSRTTRFDAAMAVLTVHHWPDREAGLARDATGRARAHRHRRLRPGAGARASGWSATTSRRSRDCTRSGSRAPRSPPSCRRRASSTIPVPRDCTRPLLRRALGAAGAGPRPRRRAADVGLAEPLRGGPAAGQRAARRRPRLGRLGGAQRAPARRRTALDVGSDD